MEKTNEFDEISPNAVSVFSSLELRKLKGKLSNVVITVTPRQLATTLERAALVKELPKENMRLLFPELPGREPLPERPIMVIPFPCREPECRRIVIEGWIICQCEEPELPPRDRCGPRVRIEADGSFSCDGECPDPFRCRMYQQETDFGLVIGCTCNPPGSVFRPI